MMLWQLNFLYFKKIEDCVTISCTLKDDLPRVFWNPLLSRDRTGQEIGTIHRKPSNFDHVQRVCLSPEKTPLGMKKKLLLRVQWEVSK